MEVLTRYSQGKKYILRVINTSVDTTFVFSIDNHKFEVMSSDFVPIQPYNVTHVLIGIGKLTVVLWKCIADIQ
jgi:FtsP/CotA-like multicopper oxidase with cupredoxin domain